MTASLPPVGTTVLLERLAAYVPDEFTSTLCLREFRPKRPRSEWPVQNDNQPLSTLVGWF